MRILSIFIICLFLMACKLESKESSQTIKSLLSSPVVSIDTESLEDITTLNAANFTLSGRCSEEGQPVIVAVDDKEDLTPITPPYCTSNKTWTTTLDLTGLGGASRRILITADHSTSEGLTLPQARKNVLLHPTLSLNLESLENITATNAAKFTLSGTCSENGQPVIVVVDKEDLSPMTTPHCTNGIWTTTIDFSGLTGASRPITITADHSTSSGLATPQARGNVLLHPTLSLNLESLENITAINADKFTLSGRCSEEGQPVIVAVGKENLSPITTPHCTNGIWTTTIDLSGLKGASRPITITADHSTSDALVIPQIIKSVLLYPRVSIDVGPSEGITASNMAHFRLSGSCSEEGQPITVRVGGLSPTTAPHCTSGAWTTTIDLTELSGVSRTFLITVDHWTSNGLASSQVIESVLLHPMISIHTALEDIMAANIAHFRLSGRCSEEGQPITLQVGGVSPKTAPTCTSSGTWAAEVNMSGLSGASRPILITADHVTSEGLAASQATRSVIAYLSFSINTKVLENITAANAASFRVSGSCLSEGEPITVYVEDMGPKTAPNCTHGAWDVHLDVTRLNKTVGDIEITADHSSPVGDVFPQDTATITNHFVCPKNYVGVPSLIGYTTKSFCVMKYEAKSDSSDAVSQASGRPYTRINRDHSIDKCTKIDSGYDLITNDEWQTLARNIELVPDNWATGVIGSAGGLSRGHSDSLPNNTLAANSDDNKGCYETGQTCDGRTWNTQRRTHTLSNGEVIWDLSGNAAEWVKDTNTMSYGTSTYMSQVTMHSHTISGSLSGGTTTTSRAAKDQFGPSGNYLTLNSAPYGNLGYGHLDSNLGGVLRGLDNHDLLAGLFSVYLDFLTTETDSFLGFRCTYHPSYR